MNTFSRREIFPLVGVALLGTSCLSAHQAESSEIKMILPGSIGPGDTVGICATAGGIRSDSEVEEFTQKLRSFGFAPKEGKTVRGRYGYFSASDKERAEEFMEMIRDEEVKAIFFIRGGWGCARVLEYLDFDVIKAHPKIIMGFSDISTLLNAITIKTGMITFHGPNGNASWNGRTKTWMEQLFFRAEKPTFANSSEDDRIRTINKGTAEGELFGGNLSVVSSLVGTANLPDWEGKILFLEDVKEEPYRIDRMLTQLSLNGIFDKVSGIVLGRFRDCVAEEKDRSFTVDQVFDQHFHGIGKPVFSGAQFGHVVEKFVLPVGAKVRMNADNGTLELLHPVVSQK